MRKAIGIVLLVGASAALGLSGPGAAPEPARVALLDVRVAPDLAADEPGLAESLTSLLTAELAGRCPLVPVPELASAAGALGVATARAADDPAIGRRLGERLGAGRLLTARVARSGDGILLEVDELRVSTGAAGETVRVTAKDVRGLPEAARNAAARISFVPESRERE